MNKQHWQDSCNVLLGIWVFLSPWILEHKIATEVPGAALGRWNLWIVGFAIVVVAVLALSAFRVWQEWVNFILGAWLLASPWVLGFSASPILMWDAVVSGLLLMACTGWVLVEERRPKPLAR